MRKKKIKMAKTVKQIIKELQTYPSHYYVAVSDHDQSEDEVSGIVVGVHLFKPSENTDWPDPSKKWVVLRC